MSVFESDKQHLGQTAGHAGLHLPSADFLAIAGILLIALVAQIAAPMAGVYAVGADGAARTLLADRLTLESAFDPFFWPPLPKIVYGIGLLFDRDLFLTPRIITEILSLCLIGAVAFLAHRLFASRTIVLISAALCAVVSHRVLFVAEPMSEPIYNPLMVLAFAFFVGVARDMNRRDVFLTCICLALACGVRYEAWFITAAFGGFLAWQCFFGRQLSLRDLLISGVIVSAFPIFWLVNAALSEQGLHILFATSDQAEALGMGWSADIRNSHLYAVIDDLFGTPLVIALVPLAVLFVADKAKRVWIIGAIASLVVVSIATLASRSVPPALPMRLSGVWTLCLLPILAYWIAQLSFRAPQRFRTGVLLAAVAIAVGALSWQTIDRLKEVRGYKSFPQEDLLAGHFVLDWLATHEGSVLVEAEASYRFLNILVASNTPERLVLSTGDDVQMVGLYAIQGEYWKTADPEKYAAFAAPRYGLASGGDAEKLRARNIHLVLVETADYAQALKASGQMEMLAKFNDWSIFSFEG